MKGRYMLYTRVMNSRLRRVQTVLMLLTREHHQDDVESKSVDLGPGNMAHAVYVGHNI